MSIMFLSIHSFSSDIIKCDFDQIITFPGEIDHDFIKLMDLVEINITSYFESFPSYKSAACLLTIRNSLGILYKQRLRQLQLQKPIKIIFIFNENSCKKVLPQPVGPISSLAEKLVSE